MCIRRLSRNLDDFQEFHDNFQMESDKWILKSLKMILHTKMIQKQIEQ